MNKKKVIFQTFIWALIIHSTYCQCPDKSVIAQNLFNKTQTNDKLQLEKLQNWQSQWQKCGFKQDSLYGVLLYRLASNYNYSKEIEKALETNNLALKVFQKSDTKISWIPKTYFKIATNYLFLKNYRFATEFFEKAIASVSHRSHQSYAIESYNYLGYIYQVEGDYLLALKKIEQALIITKKTGENVFLVDSWKEKGNIQRALGDYEKSLVSFEVASKLINPTQIQDLGSIYINIGRTYASINKTDLAIKNYEKALKVLGHSDSLLSATININLGNLYSTKLKIYDKAFINFNFALKLTNDSYQRMGVFNNIGYLFLQKKDFNATFKNYQLAYKEIFENFNEKLLNSNPSIETVKRAIRKKNILTLTKDKADAWLEYYKFNNDKQNLKYALNTYLLADKIIDFMRWEQTGDETKLFWREKTRSIYENAIETCYLLKDYEKAFYFFEKSRAVMLNDKLNELGAKQSLSETDRQDERTFIQKINELNASIEGAKNQVEKDKINTKLIDLQERQEKFIKSLETKNPAYYQLKYNNTTTTLKQFQQYLATSGKSDGFIMGVEYFIGDSATYAIVVSPYSVSLKKLNYNATNTQKFLDYCSKNINTKTELSQFLAVSSDIYKSLVQPLNIQKGCLIISQDGLFLPFEALSKSASKPEYLLNDFAISYTYSAQFLLKNTQKTTFLPQNKFLGIAPVNFVQKLSPLKGSVESLDKIAKNYFWSSKFVEQQGTKKAFLDNAKNYQIVQIYTHAFADSNETEPRIYFADSTLKVSELGVEQQFKTKLLVLSACKTAVGKVAQGEGVLSLARGFSMAGIPSTITSLWSIEDKDTYTLTELFYKYLNEGLTKDEALQKAKIEFISSNSNLMPTSWAGMVLIGDSSPILSNYWYIWILFGVLLLFVFGIWFWNKNNK